MTGFRVLLVAILVWIAGYTVVTVANHGPNLFPQFFGDMAAFGWAGQFNADFLCFLVLSALWVAWRHEYSPGGLGLSVLAFFGGAFFLSVYLLVMSFSTGGDIRVILLGPSRAS